jgi:hypothetical protein
VDGIEARSRSCPREAKKAVSALAGKVLSMTSTVKFFKFWHFRALKAGRCARAATMPSVIAAPAAARATPRRVFPLALLFILDLLGVLVSVLGVFDPTKSKFD